MTLINLCEIHVVGGVGVQFQLLTLLFDGDCLCSGGRRVEVTPGSSGGFRECV